MIDQEKMTVLNDAYYGYLREFQEQQKVISQTDPNKDSCVDPEKYEYYRGRLDGFMNCLRIVADALANFSKVKPTVDR